MSAGFDNYVSLSAVGRRVLRHQSSAGSVFVLRARCVDVRLRRVLWGLVSRGTHAYFFQASTLFVLYVHIVCGIGDTFVSPEAIRLCLGRHGPG